MFLGTFRTFTIVLSYPTGTDAPSSSETPIVPSRQSACHRPLMHAAHLNPRIQMRSESDEAHHYLIFPLELLLRHGHLSVFYIRSTLDVATWRKCSASYALGATSISTTLYTSTSVGPTTFRVGYCLFCANICPCCLIMSYNTA